VLTRDEWVLGGAVLMRAAAEWIRGTSQRHRTCPPALHAPRHSSRPRGILLARGAAYTRVWRATPPAGASPMKCNAAGCQRAANAARRQGRATPRRGTASRARL